MHKDTAHHAVHSVLQNQCPANDNTLLAASKPCGPCRHDHQHVYPLTEAISQQHILRVAAAAAASLELSKRCAGRERQQAGQSARRPAADDGAKPTHGLPASHFLPVHQEEWERQICWGDSPGRSIAAAASEERDDSDVTGARG